MNNLEKALLILETFLNREHEIGIIRLVELTGLNVSTIHRIVKVLVNGGYLIQPHARGKYSLGPKFLQYSNTVMDRFKIKDVAPAIMAKLNQKVNECVNLVVLDSNEALYVDCVEPAKSSYKLRIFTQIGARVPLYCTAVGKILLAYMTEREQEEYFKTSELIARTRNTITDPIQLMREFSSIKRDGYSIDDEETELGVRCIAAPVRDHAGDVVAAISVSGPSTRLTNPKIRELEPLLKAAALEISRSIGYAADRNMKLESKAEY